MSREPAPRLGPGGHWRNWVGNQSFIARHKAEPGSEDELAALVSEASRQNLSIRVAGSGHSFTPVVATSGLLLSLDEHAGPRRRRPRSQARRRARGHADRRYRPRAQGDRAVARQSGRHRHPGDRRRAVDRHARHGNRPRLPVVPGGRHAARSAGRVDPRRRRRPGSRNDGGGAGFDRHARRDVDDHAAGGPRLQPQGTPVARGFRVLHGKARRSRGEQSPFQLLLVSGRRVPGISTACPTSPRSRRSSASTTSAR